MNIKHAIKNEMDLSLVKVNMLNKLIPEDIRRIQISSHRIPDEIDVLWKNISILEKEMYEHINAFVFDSELYNKKNDIQG